MFINIFNYFQIILWKKEKENLQHIIVVQMYEIMKIQMHFQSNYLIFSGFLKKMCRSWKKILKWNLFIFIWTKYEKDNKCQNWVFCMGQKMMWDNVLNLSHIFCKQVQLQLCKLYN